MTRRLLCALSLVVLAAACKDVEDLLVWAPDGTQALLRAEDKLYLMTPDGTLSDVVTSGVTGAAWMPDSRRLVLTKTTNLTKWADAERLLPAAELDAAKDLADLVLALIAVDRGHTEDQITFKDPERIALAILYLSERKPAEFRAAIRKSAEGDKLEAELRATDVPLAELSIFTLASHESSVIYRAAGTFAQPVPSPTGRLVAFRQGDRLIVASQDGASHESISDHVAGPFGWMPDGKSLVYPSRRDGDNESFVLASIDRHVVVDEGGRVAGGETASLALSLSAFVPRVVCLSDGRIFFAGAAVQLPTAGDISASTRLFVIDPAAGVAAGPVAMRVEGSFPKDLVGFVPSQDGRRIALIDDDQNTVTVLDVATGRLDIVASKGTGRSRMLPAWRGNDLYFAALPSESAKRLDVFRWRPGAAPQAISTSWPDAILKSFDRSNK